MRSFHTTVAAVALFVLTGDLLFATNPFLCIRRGTSKQEYLIGEPVYIYYQLKNPWARTLPVPDVKEKWKAAEIEIAGQRFVPYPRAEGQVQQRRSLQPLEVYRYYFPVLYSFGKDHAQTGNAPHRRRVGNGLVFRRPGEYFIKIRIPEVERDWDLVLESGNRRCLANVSPFRAQWYVRVIIKMPQEGSVEECIWRRIRRDSVLKFVQTEGLVADDPAVPLELAAILLKFPLSAYHDDLQFALRCFYERKKKVLSGAEKRLIEDALKREVGNPLAIPQDLLLDGMTEEEKQKAKRSRRPLRLLEYKLPKSP